MADTQTTSVDNPPQNQALVTPGGATTKDSFMQQLQQKLLGQSDIISSESTNLENKIGEAIKSVQSSNQSSAAAVTSSFDRQIADAQKTGQQNLTSALEGQRGFAQNTAALTQLKDQTDKQVKDLEQRKQELIAQGNANAASQVAALQLQAIQFHQQAQQQVFSNLLGMANFEQTRSYNQAQIDAQNRSQNFQESSQKAQIALQYGINAGPNDTLQDIVNRAKPFASKKQQLQLDQIQSEIDKNRAQTQQAISDAQANKTLDAANIDALAQAYINNPAVLSLVKNPNSAAAILNKAVGLQATNTVKNLQSENKTKAQAQQEVMNSDAYSPADKQAILTEIDKQYGPDAKQPEKKAASFSNPLDSITSWFAQNVLGEPAPSFAR